MTLRVALIGTGGIAGRHAGAVAALAGRMQLVAACGRDAGRTDAFAGTHGIAGFTDLDRMLDTARPDLVIATHPPHGRAGEIERVAAAGVHLLVEKPIALDMAAATAMHDAVAASGVTAAIGFMYRFGDAIARWRALAAAGETGTIALYAGTYHCNSLHAWWWRRLALSGGQIVEQVIHQIDLIRHLMGEPDTVYARAARRGHADVPDYDVEDLSAITFGWDDGRIATLNASNLAVAGVWHKDWHIIADRLSGRFSGWNDAVLTRADNSHSETIAGTTDPFVAQLAGLGNAISERRPPMIPLGEGVASLRLALAARRSATERREIRLGDG